VEEIRARVPTDAEVQNDCGADVPLKQHVETRAELRAALSSFQVTAILLRPGCP
jgi:hypothetical protein